jgi:DNA-binding response OmpR family regulator
MRVLVVDDDTFMRVTLSIELSDVELVEAGRISEADELAKRMSFDAAIIDRRLGDGDGMELVRRLRSRTRTANVPVLVVTAGHDPAEEATVLRGGADAYLAKPFEAADLLTEIDRVLAIPEDRRRSQRREAAARVQRDQEACVGVVAPASEAAPAPAPAESTERRGWLRRRDERSRH